MEYNLMIINEVSYLYVGTIP